jgi:hypothetical protein
MTNKLTDKILNPLMRDGFKAWTKQLVLPFFLIALMLCSCHGNAPKSEITADMAYEGINNYCHSEFDWTPAEEDSIPMYVEMGEETDSAYQVIFRSYTGALTYFYVNKESGATRMVESVPGMDIEEDAGTINLFDYLKKE